MEVNIRFVRQILDSGGRYVIPSYQRPYTWEDEQVEELINDINEARKKEIRSDKDDGKYFIGSIIVIKREDKKYEVVDGQQRLITLTLIFRQLLEYLGKEDAAARAELERLFITRDPLDPNATPVSVVGVRETERGVYSEVLSSEGAREGRTPAEKVFVDNAKSIKKCLDDALEIGELHEGDRAVKAKSLAVYMRDKVRVVFLEVDDMANAYRLFNVLNNRGTPLNDADLLKNKLLEEVHGDDAGAESIEDSWRKMEECVTNEKEKNLSTFLSINRTSEKENLDRRSGEDYKYYEDRLGNRERQDGRYKGGSVLMAKDLLKSTRNYQDLISASRERGIPCFVGYLLRLQSHKEWLPVFLAFLNKCEENNYRKEEDLRELARVFEQVYMHRCLSGANASQRMAPCYHAIQQINTGANFRAVEKAIIGQSKNESFKAALDGNFYDAHHRRTVALVKYALLRVEDERHSDPGVGKQYDLDKITVEHIMPQNRGNKYWTDRFTEKQHEEWLHKLGNLTLLPRDRNSVARDLGFDEKKEAYRADNQRSGYSITQEVCNTPEWNLEAIQERHDRLKEEILKIWWVERGVLDPPEQDSLFKQPAGGGDG